MCWYIACQEENPLSFPAVIAHPVVTRFHGMKIFRLSPGWYYGGIVVIAMNQFPYVTLCWSYVLA